jgi:hypothetical protein
MQWADKMRFDAINAPISVLINGIHKKGCKFDFTLLNAVGIQNSAGVWQFPHFTQDRKSVTYCF